MTQDETKVMFAAEVYNRLERLYGTPDWRPRYEPMDELVLTFLSQSTSDLNSGRAFAELKKRYPTWEEVMAAPVAEVADAIRVGGLSLQKAPRIQAALRRIKQERGEFSISHLADMPTPEAMAWLTTFDGIGHKTASIVLLFCFGKPTFPVDTHVGRVSRRLGIADQRAGEEKIKEIWEALAPPEWFLPLHLNIIRHGREVCSARRPACPTCLLNDICRYHLQTGE